MIKKTEEISLELLEDPIASGRTAEIYEWKEGYILKLFYKCFPLNDVEHEARIADVVLRAGLPVPAVGKIIKINGRYGLVYERVRGISMMETLVSKPWTVIQYARILAELQVNLHKVGGIRDLPSQHERLRKKILFAEKLPSDLRKLVLQALEEFPEGNMLCHGDFHPGNILMIGKKAMVIDWLDCTCGNPLADVARSTIITLGACIQTSNPFMKAFFRIFHAAYIHHYFSICPNGEHEYRLLLPVVAAARLSENIPELQKWLIAEAQKIDGKCFKQIRKNFNNRRKTK